MLNLRNKLRFILILICIFPITTLVCTAAPAPAKFNVLILTGVNNHDWRATTPVLRQILESTGMFDTHVNEEGRGCGPETFAPYDLLVLNYNDWKNSGPWWDNRARQAILDFVRNGKGIVFYHAANNAFWGWPEYDKLVGGTWRETAGHSPYHAYTLKIVDPDHPITKGLPSSFPVTDELYHGLSLQPNIHILATAWDDPAICRSPGERCGTDKNEPLMWVQNYGAGRVFQTALGHDTKAMQNLVFQITLQRGAEWATTGSVTISVPADLK